MQEPSRTIEISSASVIDLKAELFKQKEEFKKQREEANNQPVSAALRKSVKKPGLWERQNKGVNERSHRDELELVDAPTLEASRIAMERKAKLYDQLKKTGISDDRLAEEVLVDFDRKAWENPSDDESNDEKQNENDDPWVEYVDEFGRTRLCRKSQLPKDDSSNTSIPDAESAPTDLDDTSPMEDERQRWEEAALKELKSGPIHYDETKEIRTKGVGFYRFSKDEEERQKQMRELKEMRLETEMKRAGHQSIKNKRKAQLDARIAMIRSKRQKNPVAASSIEQTTENIITTKSDAQTKNNTTAPPIFDASQDSVKNINTLDVNTLLSDIRKQVESQSRPNKRS
ncbi:13860_t:CDS:2 [Acaulospora morrowiae]|uniref:13860_t:CDS:1 n=1 Tax=Acaulospora morrowiae TaxID=94023 RepID=A0A9N9A7P2_9GLOM|nr:13860_t:CDS:2 [Acaulospora morrowiae]